MPCVPPQSRLEHDLTQAQAKLASALHRNEALVADIQLRVETVSTRAEAGGSLITVTMLIRWHVRDDGNNNMRLILW